MTLDAPALGATDLVAKPAAATSVLLEDFAEELRGKIRLAAPANGWLHRTTPCQRSAKRVLAPLATPVSPALRAGRVSRPRSPPVSAQT